MIVCLVDTETTMQNNVADFGAVIADLSTGEILDQIGSLIYGQFNRAELWFDYRADPNSFWSAQNTRARRKQYKKRIANGSRSIASPALINIWLAKNCGRYNPAVTAYNLPFDSSKCDRTGINLGMFSRSFCLLKAARATYMQDSKFIKFCYDNDALTKTGRPSFTADNVSHFLLGDSLDPEPHTALEDARDYELPIALDLYKRGAL